MTEKEFFQEKKRFAGRWHGQEDRIALIIQAIRDHEDWTIYLDEFEHEGSHFARMPWIEEVDTHKGTKNPMDLRGIPIEDVDLSGCYLTGASFHYAQLHSVDFTKAVIQGSYTTFFGTHILSCCFKLSDLVHTHWESLVMSMCDFSDAKLYGAKFKNVSIRYTDFSRANFDHVRFENVIFLRPVFYNVYITESTYLGFSGKWQLIEPRNDMMDTEKKARDKRYYDEFDKFSSQGEAYAHSAKIYRELKLSAKSHGLYSLGGIFHYRERKCERLAQKRVAIPAKLSGLFQEMILGYGEKPFRVIATSFLVILSFGVVFLLFGFEYSSSSGAKIVDRDMVLDLSEVWATLSDFGLALYMSVVTFSTLGYGDTQPLSIARIAAALEALVGLVLMAMFVATFARVIIRD